MRGASVKEFNAPGLVWHEWDVMGYDTGDRFPIGRINNGEGSAEIRQEQRQESKQEKKQDGFVK